MLLTKINTAVALLLVGGFIAAACFSIPRVSAELPDAPEKRAPVQLQVPGEEGKKNQTAEVLAGGWRMTLPAGFQYQVIIRPLGENRISVENAVRLSGVYELRDGRLVLVEPTNRGEQEFEWELRGPDELALVAQPHVRRTGANYLGATLKRLSDEKELILHEHTGSTDGRAQATATGSQASHDSNEMAKPPAPEEAPSPDEAQAARALERIKTEYRLKKEPAYQARVQYCLVLLGREARTRLWLASDGKRMYVDKNGDGDLTQPGEAIPFTPDKDGGFASFMTDRFPGHRGDRPHTSLHIAVRQRDWEKNKGGYWAVRATVGGQYPMYAFAHKFAQKHEQAPVIHLGGPLRLGLYALEGGRLVPGRQAELNAYVGCHYPGIEKGFVDVDKWERKDVHPLAEIRLPARAPGAEPITLRVPLTQRC